MEVVDDSPSAFTEDSLSVRVVDHQEGVVAGGQLGQFGQGGDVSVHGENAVGDDQAATTLFLLQLLFEVVGVAVFENDPPRLGETASVDDGGMVQLVGEEHVFRGGDEGGDGSQVRAEARLEGDRGFRSLEGGHFFLHFQVNLHGSGDGTDRRRAHSILLDSLDGSLFQLRVVGESKVVVDAHVQNFLAVDDGPAVLGRADGPDGVEQTVVLESFYLFCQKRVFTHSCILLNFFGKVRRE